MYQQKEVQLQNCLLTERMAENRALNKSDMNN